jgi:glycogen debranching enzyme
VRLRGTGGIGLRLTLERIGGYGNAQPYDRAGRWLVNAWPARMTFLLSPQAGRLAVDAPFRTVRAERVAADFLPDGGGTFEATVEEFLPEHTPAPPATTFDEDSAGMPPAPDALRSTADLMAYVQWSALVAPEGHLRRPAVLMSKNHMTNVWSWDHCFNALALMPHAPALAWDQFLLPFDHQDAAGALPDSVNDKSIVRSFTKPPIHGWTLRGLLERDHIRFLTPERLGEVYGPLSRWTRWWLTFRDADGDGVPQYNHGNDSGWDNSTAFDAGFPLEGPDLSAFLVLQMDALADLARRLDRPDEAAQWTQDADTLLDRLMAHSWRGDRFLAPRSGDHADADAGDSLLPFLPLALGDRLPGEARGPLRAGLLTPGRFLCDYGLATEALTSPQHEADGYWRGPVWAPPVLLLADGLRRMGEDAAARDIAARFCRAVAESGAAENFHARTGAGLRDRAYTWTASVFLILAQDYLNP